MLWGFFNKRHKLKEDWHLSGPSCAIGHSYHFKSIITKLNEKRFTPWHIRCHHILDANLLLVWTSTTNLIFQVQCRYLQSQTMRVAYLAKSCKVCSSYGYSTRHIIFSSQNRVTSRDVPAHAGTVLHRPLSMEWSEIPKYLQHQGSVFHFGFIVGQFIHQMVSRSLLCKLSEEICSL